VKLIQETSHPEDYNSRTYIDSIYQLDTGGFIRVRRLIDSMGSVHTESICEVKEAQVKQTVYDPVGSKVKFDIGLD
jgi:hypothetical protein